MDWAGLRVTAPNKDGSLRSRFDYHKLKVVRKEYSSLTPRKHQITRCFEGAVMLCTQDADSSY